MTGTVKARLCLLAFAVSCGGAVTTTQAPATHSKQSSWTPPTSQDTHDDPDRVRPGYGNAALHVWFPLTQAQVASLANVDKAKQGDAQALSAIAQAFGAAPGSDLAAALVGKYPEVAAMLAPQNAEAVRARILAYEREGHAFYEQNAWRTMVKMVDVVAPSVSETAKTGAGNNDTMSGVAWVTAFYALALAVVGRGDEAVATVSELLDHFDDHWSDATALRGNAYKVIDDRMLGLMADNDYEKAVRVPAAHIDGCRADKYCSSNLSIVYRNWAADKSNAGDWPAARDALKQCTTALPDDAQCKSELTDLESRHQF